ncbi:hypothetical protein [Flavobacterium rhizosphaerae]|uniref:Uncharacterized protein n=1 Tax=Flavobacterium rhizosphaerae TaxID=3163298 RepID=A0ABW8Z0S2_9FLAO
MNREDLRPVAFTVTEKVKKGKKTATKTKTKSGYFHLWGSVVDKKGKEEFYALVEDAKTGKLLEVSFKDIRFVNEITEEIFIEAFEGEVNETEATPETTEANAEQVPAETASEVTPETVAEAPAVEGKPKPARKARPAKK